MFILKRQPEVIFNHLISCAGGFPYAEVVDIEYM